MIIKELFGKMPCGCEVFAYTLTNKTGASVRILNLGGVIQQINMPDRDGNFADLICGYDTVEDYLVGGGYHGALIGRYGNRIANGRFTLNGVTYQLAQNSGISNHLHGGNVGFNAKIWDVVPFEKPDECGLILTLTSPDGDENYPGKLDVTVTYTLTDANELGIHYEAVTDKDTVVNMTNHAYFNLGGFNSGSVCEQLLWIDSDAITEVDDNLIPTGRDYAVEGTAFDFRVAKPIGKDFDADDAQIKIAAGYDHNFILNNGGKLAKVATVYDPKSGRAMDCTTDQTGVQIYAACKMEGEVPFKGGYTQKPRHAVCLETQHAPDSPNHPSFPSTTLKVGEKYDTTTIYTFYVK